MSSLLKKILVSLIFILHVFGLYAQTIDGYNARDYLVSAVHPMGCDASFVTGPPDHKTWVNFNAGDEMTGLFGYPSVDSNGYELLLETSYHADNYYVSLLLSNNTYSNTHYVDVNDWTRIADTAWLHIFRNCLVGTSGRKRYILPLDYSSDFSLCSTDTVMGIKIIFLHTAGAADLAGIYIIKGKACETLNLGRDTTLCMGDILTLNTQIQNATYKWQDNSTQATFRVTKSGKYWVEVRHQNCILRDTIQVTYSLPPVVDLGPDTFLCKGETYLLNASTPFASYLWQDNSSAPIFAVKEAGTYWVKLTMGHCSSSDSVYIVSKNKPLLNLGSDTFLCSGDIILLAVNNTYDSYLWQNHSQDTFCLASKQGIYWLQVSKNACSNSDSIRIIDFNIPQQFLGRDTIICEGDQLQLDLSNLGANYLWQDGSTTTNYTISKQGFYWLTIVNECGVYTDSIYVKVFPLSKVNLGNDTILCFDDTLLLNVYNANSTYLWQDNSTESSFSISEKGLYWVKLTNSCGQAGDTLRVEMNYCDCIYFIANAFSPNKDSINDYFSPMIQCEINDYVLKIFNRWGEMIFETNNAYEAWHGTFNNQPAPLGTYYYVMKIKSWKGKVYEKYGSVQLIR
ncbi:MAG: gliding motility-associated C-terminal domain-containing protein [Bacteroidetes bacterium]|jgi:gliding motility-associated-like protein|nr:gliding motility-associated C-terminal domain-containing protein [Bacteroidota bacterium]MBT5992465.1 gliding motility-associated C-terminal domain-containing protein [Bacteroidota bacterium]